MDERSQSHPLASPESGGGTVGTPIPFSPETIEFSQVVERIYQGSTDPTQWAGILSTVAQWVGSEKSVLFTPTLLPSMGGFEYGYKLSTRMLSTRNEWGHLDPSAIAATQKGLFREGAILLDTDLVPSVELVQNKTFQKYFAQDDISRMLACVIFGLDSSGVPPLVLCQYRGEKGQDFGPVEKERMRLLLPHLSRSLGIMVRICHAEMRAAASLASLDKLDKAVVLLNQHSGICFANTAALRLLNSRDGLEVQGDLERSIDARLRVTSSTAAHNEMQEGITCALNQNLWAESGVAQTIAVARPSGKPPFVLQICALPAQNGLWIPTNQARAIVFISDPVQPASLIDHLLSSAYGITSAEARVAEFLVKGDTVKQVARQTGLSVSTIQTQIRHLYEKLGVNTRGQFVRLMQIFSSPDNGA